MKICILLLLLFHIVYFFPLYFTEKVLFQRDLPFLTLPAKFEAVSQWRKGIIPFWSEKFSNGQPLLANPTSSSLYPLMIPLIISPDLKTFTYLCLFHHLLFILGVFLFSNLFLRSPFMSLALSTFLGYNGIIIEFFSFCNPLWGIMYLPYTLITFYKYLKEGKKIYFLFSTLLFSLSIYAGFDISVFVFSFSLILLTIFVNYKKIPYLLLLFLITFFISSPQILPALFYLPLTSRGSQDQIYQDTSGFYSLHPLRIADLIVPHFHGFQSPKGKIYFWADAISDRNNGLFISPYLGIFSILLLFSLRPFRYRWLFFSGTLLFLLLSSGRYFPLHFFFQKLPLISTIRFPEKYLIFLIIFFALFIILNFKNFEKISLAPSIIIISILSFLFLLNIITSGRFLKNYISGTTYQEITIQPNLMQKNLSIAILMVIFIIIFFYLFNKDKKFLYFLPLIFFGDFYYGTHHRITPYPTVKINSPLAPILKEQKPQRLLHNEIGAEYNPANKNITIFKIETLCPHFGSLFGFSYAFSRSVDAMEPAYINRKLENIDYKLWGISHIILSGMKAPKDSDFKRFLGYDLLRIDKNATYIWFFEEESREVKPLPSPKKIENPNKIQISIRNKKRGMLWVGFSNLPGWKVFVNGKERKMANPEAEGLNVFLEPGDNKIEFIYKTPGFKEGIILMVSGIFLCAIILLWKKGN